ncbi:MAG TPA: UPF0182 family protein [Streptosporangiaceae bacterium]|jgi:hypothetical protein
MRTRRWPRILAVSVASIVAFVIVIVIVSGVWTDYLWFASVRYTSVFATAYGVKWALFGIVGAFMAALVVFNAVLAYRLRPVHRPGTAEQRALDGYRIALERRRRLMVAVAAAVVGLIAGLSASGSWRTWLLFANRTSFHARDPQFRLDISFFVFVYPFIRMVLTFLFAAVLVSVLVAVAVHYLYGGVRLQRAPSRPQPQGGHAAGGRASGPGGRAWGGRAWGSRGSDPDGGTAGDGGSSSPPGGSAGSASGAPATSAGGRPPGSSRRATVAARAHLFALLGVFVLLKAVAYWIDRFGIDEARGGTVSSGASYTDVNAILPAKTVLAVIALVCALLFFAGAVRRSAMMPAVGFGLLVLSAILVGGVYPAVIQQFVVKPNALAKESPYLRREISATRAAYAVGHTVTTPYQATIAAQPGAGLAAQAAALPSLRLIDPGVVSQTFQQLQQVKGFYRFPGQLDMDRYQVPGGGPQPRDMVVGVRDLAGPPPGQGNWINTHLVYTHGFGFVAASANTVQANGDPSFTESDIPPRGALGSFQPRVYFGDQETQYAIAGAPRGRAPMELDYPVQSAAGQRDTTYAGGGGVPVGSALNRLLYAIKLHEPNVLLSGAINGNSRILYVRDPLSRVAKVAPFLTLDGDAYPVVAGHGIYWVVDGYTTSDQYPYSQGLGLAAADDSVAGVSAYRPPGGQLNYIRNSVKAVVNAYTGSVALYQWDTADPVLRTWMKAFGGVVKPRRDIPAALLPHLRYPQALFDAQRQILASYHVTQAQAFYAGQNFWTVPADPSGDTPDGSSQPPYYLTMSMPGYSQPEFSLSTSFVQRGRPNMAAFMAVDSNPLSPGYGTIRILGLPQDTAIAGPQQVQNSFETDPTASIQLSQLRRGGSRVTLGNLITLPVSGGFLYVEPVYVEAAAQASTATAGAYPTVQRVFASMGGDVGYGSTLSAALGQLFGVSPGSPAGAAGSAPGSAAPGSAGAAIKGSSAAAAAAQEAAVLGYLKQAQADYQRGQAALKSGNFGAYGQDMASMKTALDRAQQAAEGQRAALRPRMPPGSAARR